MTFVLSLLIINCVLWMIALLVIPPRRSPSSGTAWLLLITLLPVPGWLLFALLGHYKLPKNRRDIQKRINKDIDQAIAQLPTQAVEPIMGSSRFMPTNDLATAYGRLPSLPGNKVTIQADYDQALADMTRDIDAAKASVYVEYYAATLDVSTQAFFAALVRAHERGVDVRVLFDSWGSRSYEGYRPMRALLDEVGIPYYAMLPLKIIGTLEYVRPDLRNHRKIVVIDRTIGYTGSQNLIDKTYHRKDAIVYDELVVRVVGPVALEVAALFMTDWVSEGGTAGRIAIQPSFTFDKKHHATLQVLPSGPGFESENNLHVFTDLIYRAERSITIVNPYLVPPESLLSAIQSAAHRGVQVQIVNSRAIDQWMVGYAQRSFYASLLEAGVEIYLYDFPYLLHTKIMVIDDEVAIVGSSNMDMRSFNLTSELSLLCYDAAVAKNMKKVTATYLQKSQRLPLDEWRQRSVTQRVLENIARLTSALQ